MGIGEKFIDGRDYKSRRRRKNKSRFGPIHGETKRRRRKGFRRLRL